MQYCMGCIGKCDDWVCIVIKNDLSDQKKRQTIAHELAHYLTDTIGHWNPTHEGMANRKARELLIPETTLREYLDDNTDYAELACMF